MLKRWLVGMTMAAALAFAAPVGTFAQDTQTTTPKQDIKKAGQETKEAGKAAGDATKDAGKATGKATKKTAKRVSHDTKHAVGKTTATCKDGTTQTGRTKTTACSGHGGIADGK